MSEKNNGSYLNEEYTKQLEDMYEYVRKAGEIYNALPVAIKETKTSWDGDSIRFYLANAVNATRQLANAFGIDVDGKED